MMVWGLADFSSYGYPAGGNVGKINPVVVMAAICKGIDPAARDSLSARRPLRLVRLPGGRQRRQDQTGRPDRPRLVSGDPQPSRPRGARPRPPAADGVGLLRVAAPTTSAACAATSTRSTSSRCTTACWSTSRGATLATTVLGQRVAMPMLVAPTAFHRLAHTDGELASVRAAGDAGTRVHAVHAVEHARSRMSSRPRPGPVWFQLYVYRDRGATEALVRRVEAAGCRALVLTVDAPLLGRRERDVRNRFALPPQLGDREPARRRLRAVAAGSAASRGSPRTSRSCSIRALTWERDRLAALDHPRSARRS